MSSPTQRRLGRLVGQLQLGAPEICAASTNAARQKARRAKLRVNANDAQVDASPDQPLKGVLLLIVEMAMVIAAAVDALMEEHRFRQVDAKAAVTQSGFFTRKRKKKIWAPV
jgi:hypothetical protein